MIKGNNYQMMINHLSHTITQIKRGDSWVQFEVILLDKEKNPFDLYPFGMNAHFNVKGYRKSSQIILENIKD